MYVTTINAKELLNFKESKEGVWEGLKRGKGGENDVIIL